MNNGVKLGKALLIDVLFPKIIIYHFKTKSYDSGLLHFKIERKSF